MLETNHIPRPITTSVSIESIPYTLYPDRQHEIANTKSI